jgi:hypothetical protein
VGEGIKRQVQVEMTARASVWHRDGRSRRASRMERVILRDDSRRQVAQRERERVDGCVGDVFGERWQGKHAGGCVCARGRNLVVGRGKLDSRSPEQAGWT